MAKKGKKGGKKGGGKAAGGDATENVEEKRRLDLIEVAKSLTLAVDREERDFNEFQQQRVSTTIDTRSISIYLS